MSEITYPRTDGATIDSGAQKTAPPVQTNRLAPLSAFAARILVSNDKDKSRISPEQGAVKHEEPIAWGPKTLDFIPKGWVNPDSTIEPGQSESDKPTCAFATAPVPVLLPAGSVVYRVIGKSPDGGLGNSPSGSWWSLEPPPQTEAKWRADYAVCGHWNGDGGYIKVTLKEDVRAWQGPVAPHRSQVAGYYLPGGAMQIWVPPGTIDPIRDGATLDDILQPTPWREKELNQG